MEKKKILIVDDEESLGAVFKMIIEKAGNFEVRSVTRGSQAFDVAKQFNPDLLLLDIMMPDVDGGEVANRMKADKQTKNIPIVFVSAAITREEAIKQGSILGGYPVIAKPVPTEELIETIEKYTGEKATSRVIEDIPPLNGKKIIPLIDRRKHRRIDTTSLLSYFCLDENGNPTEEGVGNALNISQGGLLLETTLPIEGKKIQLTASNSKDELINIKGKVVYSEIIEPGLFHTGVNFRGSDKEIRGFVVELIKVFNLQKDR